MITSMRRCVACDDLWPWPISSRSFDLDFENRVRSVMFSVLDRLFFWLGIQYDPIVWVIMRRRGVSSERRRSSCSSLIRSSHVNVTLPYRFPANQESIKAWRRLGTCFGKRPTGYQNGYPHVMKREVPRYRRSIKISSDQNLNSKPFCLAK